MLFVDQINQPRRDAGTAQATELLEFIVVMPEGHQATWLTSFSEWRGAKNPGRARNFLQMYVARLFWMRQAISITHCHHDFVAE